MNKILIVWGNWGPYHYARFRRFHEEGKARGLEVLGLELFRSSGTYAWKTEDRHPSVHHLDLPGQEMDFRPRDLAGKVIPWLWRKRPDVVFVPSYWHWSLVINYASRLRGARIVMMNESHAGTERARGWKKSIKRSIVSHFHAGFVGGTPHRNHFAALGLPEEKITLGYDAVDNDYFSRRSDEVRAGREDFRRSLDLPEQYFLNLGRMVKKKNLPLLLRAYANLLERRPELPHSLVLVGSGEEEPALRQLATELNLPVVDHTDARSVRSKQPVLAGVGDSVEIEPPSAPIEQRGVHFYGFRQIEENPVFYALASAFILPSNEEEWGLVVNEAMACSLPVLVSDRLGCAPDLVATGGNGFTFPPDSVDALANAMEAVADPELATRMGRESRRRIKQWGCDRFAQGAVEAAKLALSPKPSKA